MVRSRVERELDNLRDWSVEDRKKLRDRLFDELYDENEEVKKMSEMVPLDKNKEELESWLRTSGKLRGLTTGYWTLDRMTAGLCGGDLDIISAPSSVGKTLLVVNMIARQIAQNHKVAFVTLEMSQKEIAQRLYSIMTPEYYGVFMQDEPILVQKGYRVPFEAIKYSVQQAKEQGAEVFYIDHLHYFSRSMQNQTEGLGVITQECKRLAIEYDIPIVLVSQMRKTEGGRPTGDDLRGSALIRQDADIVLILDKDTEHMRMDGATDNVRVTLDKNRDRLIWKIGSEAILWKYGLDLREDKYNANLDAQQDVTGVARGGESSELNFVE